MKKQSVFGYKIDSSILIMFFTLPSLSYSYGYTSSSSSLIIILQLFFLLIYNFTSKTIKINIKFFSLAILISLIIFTHKIFIFFFYDFSFPLNITFLTKLFFSYLSIIIYFYSLFILNNYFLKTKNSEIYFYKLTKNLIIVMFILSFFILIRFSKFSPYYIFGPNDLPMFLSVYSEPSHFIVNFLPIFFFFTAINPNYKIILLTIGLLLSIAYPSLSLLYGILLITIILFPILNIIILIGLILIFYLFFTYLSNESNFELISYFTDRLNFANILSNCTSYFTLNNNVINFNQFFNENICSINYSLIYYLKSLHEMYLNLVNYPFGIGFQNFGIIGMESLFRQLAYFQSGTFKTDISLNSAFLLTKLISEFGIFALIFLIYYLKIFLGSFIFLKSQVKILQVKKKYLLIFYHISILSFSTELFVRGFGYFSIGSFLFILSIMGLYNKINNEN
jgi:hypothetical protein